MGYSSDIAVSREDEGYVVQINNDDTGILIGYHGQTLAALQTVLGHIMHRRLGQWLKLALNVSDYWQKREEQLSNLARRAVEEVKNTRLSYTLPYLNAKERRFIHMLLQDETEVSTESVGEGRERRLVIFPA